jgi:abequosyltransferase
MSLSDESLPGSTLGCDAAPRIPLLSICVPTYNRSAELHAMLCSLEAALARLSGDQRSQIEVLIADNASPDRTAEVVELHRGSLPSLRTWRNPNNLGAEGNFRALLERAQGDYVWFFGDDDRMLPTAVLHVWPLLHQGHGLVLLNYSIWDEEWLQCIRPNGRRLNHDEIESDHQAFLARHGARAGYLSATVIRRQVAVDADPSVYRELAPYLSSFLYLAYAGLPSSRRSAAFTPEVALHNHSAISFDWIRAFEGWDRALIKLAETGYSHRAIRKARRRLLAEDLMGHIVGRATMGTLSRRAVAGVGVRRMWDLPLLWLLVLPTLLLPSPLLRRLSGARRRWLSSRSPTGNGPAS